MGHDGHSGRPAASAGRSPGVRRRGPDRAQASGHQLRVPALSGGKPARGRELRAQGQRTVGRLLEAALAEFDEHGFQAVRVDDIVRRAQISHGTFYLYLASKEDLFKVLVQGALQGMALVADEFPVVTRDSAGGGEWRCCPGCTCSAGPTKPCDGVVDHHADAGRRC